MTYTTFFGCLLIAYGPPLAVFFIHVAPVPHLVILTISSMFFWLLSILTTAIWWIIIPPMQNIPAFIMPFSVVFQEAFRLLYYYMLKKSGNGLNIVAKNPNSPYNRVSYSFVSGLGFGIVSSLIMYIRVLTESIGPGYLQCPSCPSVSLFFISALTTLLFTFLHVVWMMLAFEGFHRKSYIRPLWVLVTHIGCSYITMFNSSSVPYGCAANLLLNFGILLISAIWVLVDLKNVKGSV